MAQAAPTDEREARCLPTARRPKVKVVRWANADSKRRNLAFDHAEQSQAAHSALRQRVKEHALPLHLMSEGVTLTHLQLVREVIRASGESESVALDKGTFRRRSAGNPNIVEIPGRFEGEAQRPAQLFKVAPEFRFWSGGKANLIGPWSIVVGRTKCHSRFQVNHR